MSKALEAHMNLWFVWNYGKEEERLDQRSKQGLHLAKPGLVRSKYQRSLDARYVYRLDYQPQLRTQDAKTEYLILYSEAGWEHLGECTGWHYFRQPWSPGRKPALYTDKESLHQFYRRIRNALVFVLLMEVAGFMLNISVLTLEASRRPETLFVLSILVMTILLLGYGSIVFHRRSKV